MKKQKKRKKTMTRFYIWKSLDSHTIHAIWGEFRFVGIDVPPKIIEVEILSMFCEMRENIKIQFLQWNRPTTTIEEKKSETTVRSLVRSGDSNTERLNEKHSLTPTTLIFLCNDRPTDWTNNSQENSTVFSTKQKLWIKFTFAVIDNSMKFQSETPIRFYSVRKRDFPKQMRFSHSLMGPNSIQCECVFMCSFSQPSKNNHRIHIEIMYFERWAKLWAHCFDYVLRCDFVSCSFF